MLRKCHCKHLLGRDRYSGSAATCEVSGETGARDQYLRFVASEVRTLMAALGFRTMDEMIGRVD